MESDLCLRKNVGAVDRLARAALAVVAALYPALAHWPLWAVALLGAFAGMQLSAAITAY